MLFNPGSEDKVGRGDPEAVPGPAPHPTPPRPSRQHPILPSGPQEFEVIAQIKLLQSACNNYSITPEEHFGAWFRAMERLSEAER